MAVGLPERRVAAGTEPAGADLPRSEAARYAWRVFSVTSIGAIITALNNSTLDVALPTVSRHFAATPSEASWFLLSYMLVNTILILTFGRLADLTGRRRLYLGGMALFTLASAGCGLAPTAGTLIALRVAQAVGGAAVVTNTTPLIVDAFPSTLLPVGLAMNITVISAAQVAGPLVGGAMATFFGWSAVFWFNVPMGAAGVVWAVAVLRRGAPATGRERFDVASAVVSAVGLGGVVVALSEGGARGWTQPVVLVGAVAAVVAVPAFVRMQRVRRHALVDLSLVASRERGTAYLCTFAATASRFAAVLIAAIFFQAASGVSAFQAGLRVLPTAAGMLIASMAAGRIIARFGPQACATAGLGLSAAALLTLAMILQPDVGAGAAGLSLLALGIGTGIFLPANTSSVMAGVPERRRGVANGVRSMMQNTGIVVGTAMSLAIATNALDTADKKAAYAGTLERVSGRELTVFVSGCRWALLALFLVCLVALFFVATTRSRRGHGRTQGGRSPRTPTVQASHN